jgi:gamma-glutamyltranspeptidase
MLSSFFRSVNDIFGSQVMTDTGILLNNQMADFADPENNDTKHMTVIRNNLSLTGQRAILLHNHVAPQTMINHCEHIIGRTKISSYP